MAKRTDTTGGWWTDRPERARRPTQFGALSTGWEPLPKEPTLSGWAEVAFIVPVSLALAVATVRLI